jgi:hypothetical protein
MKRLLLAICLFTATSGMDVPRRSIRVAVNLPNSTPTPFVRLGIPIGAFNSGILFYGLYATDGIASQITSGTLMFSMLNVGGTETCAVQDIADARAPLLGVGSLVLAFSCRSNAANTIDILVDSNTSLMTVTHTISYRVVLNRRAPVMVQ